MSWAATGWPTSSTAAARWHGGWPTACATRRASTILNDVVLNQVLVRFAPPDGGSDAEADDFTRRVIAAVQADGTCWLGGTTWHGMAAMRISVSNWSTTEEDADVSVAAIRRCAAAVAAEWSPAASPARV